MDRQKLENLADEILPIIRKHSTPTKISHLANKFKVESDEIIMAIKSLTDWGYRFKIAGGEITFLSAPDNLLAQEITYQLKTDTLGKVVHAYRTLKSTNDIATNLAEKGAVDGTIVTSEEQTKGRGRFTRNWHSPTGTGIYLSIILKPKLKPPQAPGISIMTAVALADTLADYCPGRVQIKWPNDVLLNGKKTAGILTELSAERDKIDHIIVGVGINVNQGAGNFPEEIRDIATSVRRVARRKINRVELLQKFLVNFEKEYKLYKKHLLKKAHGKIRTYSSLIGHEIKIKSGRNITEGLVVDIDTDGCLVLNINGTPTPITAGEVTVVKE